MEIINGQNGQPYASIQSETSVIDSKPSFDDNNVSLKTVPSAISENETTDKGTPQGVAKDLSQGSSSDADRETVESKQAKLETAVQEVESFLKVQNRNLSFTIDEETQRSIVTVKDSKSGDVIRQIPSEEVIALAERIQDLQQDVGDSVGVFINNRV